MKIVFHGIFSFVNRRKVAWLQWWDEPLATRCMVNSIVIFPSNKKINKFPSFRRQKMKSDYKLHQFAWQLMALLLLRHALAIPDADGEDDVSTFFSVRGIWLSFHPIASLCYSVVFNLTVKPSSSSCWFSAAFLASSCRISSSLLHHGLGH